MASDQAAHHDHQLVKGLRHFERDDQERDGEAEDGVAEGFEARDLARVAHPKIFVEADAFFD